MIHGLVLVRDPVVGDLLNRNNGSHACSWERGCRRTFCSDSAVNVCSLRLWNRFTGFYRTSSTGTFFTDSHTAVKVSPDFTVT